MMISIAFQLLFYFFIIPSLSDGVDTLFLNQSLSGTQTIISNGGKFEMGFFKPGKSSNYYIGIWYSMTVVNTIPSTVVWVANRDRPISDLFSSRLKIVDGNLVLLDESSKQIWSTNIKSTTPTYASVVLNNDGNLILRYGSNSTLPIWQSFDHPTHTFLPGGKLGYNKRTYTKQILTSWRNDEDPGMGIFSLEIDQNNNQFVLKWNESVPYWSSGRWNERDKLFAVFPEMRLNYIYNFSYVDNENESYFTYSLYNHSIISRFFIDVSGQSKQLSWLDSTQSWNLFWSQPRQICDVYGGCGPLGVCNDQSFPFCNCLTDFEPRSPSDWDMGDSSGGCVRKTELCKIKKHMFISSYVRKDLLPVFPNNEATKLDESTCRSFCLDYCLCSAYTFISNKCQHWDSEKLNNISQTLEEYSEYSILDPIYIKVSSSDHSKINTKVLVAGIVSGFLGLVFLCSIGVVFYRRMKLQDPGMLSEEDIKGLEVPFFEFKSIVSATENFSPANKLGQGGFGPVYKYEGSRSED